MENYAEVNLAHWNRRVVHHVRGYKLEQFRTDQSYLSEVIRFDLPRLGSIEDLDIIHLQCG